MFTDRKCRGMRQVDEENVWKGDYENRMCVTGAMGINTTETNRSNA